VTGTDTNVGKTLISALLLNHFAKQNKQVAYYKPIQTGCTEKDSEENWIAPDLQFIQKYSPKAKVHSTYNFALPATPELAAEQENTIIDFAKIESNFHSLEKTNDIVIVEGAGGLFVPIGKKRTIADLIVSLKLPALLVSVNKLGTINQTCLSSFYGQSKGIDFCGFLFNTPLIESETTKQVSDTNADFISSYSLIQYLGEIKQINLNDVTSLKEEREQMFIQKISNILLQ